MAGAVTLVTGATGWIGTHLVDVLRASGESVRACGRRPRPEVLDPGVEYAQADLSAGEELGPLVQGVHKVFHLAGASSSRSGEEEMRRDNAVATANLTEAARAAGVERFVHVSTTAVYGEKERLPVPVPETVEPHPSRGYGKAKWMAEQAVWRACEAGLPAVVVRPVSVHGPGAVKLLASAVLDVALERHAGLDRVAVHEEPIEQRLVHLDDVVAACVHLASHPDAPGRAFNVASGVYPTSHELAGAIAAAFDMELELSDDPDCGLSPDERRELHAKLVADGMVPEIILSPERFRLLRKANPNNRVSLVALAGTGFAPRHTDVAADVEELVAWYRERDWLPPGRP